MTVTIEEVQSDKKLLEVQPSARTFIINSCLLVMVCIDHTFYLSVSHKINIHPSFEELELCMRIFAPEGMTFQQLTTPSCIHLLPLEHGIITEEEQQEMQKIFKKKYNL
jgi:hypothetical protein